MLSCFVAEFSHPHSGKDLLPLEITIESMTGAVDRTAIRDVTIRHCRAGYPDQPAHAERTGDVGESKRNEISFSLCEKVGNLEGTFAFHLGVGYT